MKKDYLAKITKFLAEANKNTYAGEGKKAPSTRLKSEDFEFKKGTMTYHDTYFGGKEFLGCEIIYEGDAPIWGMNYYGFRLEQSPDYKIVDTFLRKALMKDPEITIPVRGPEEFSDGDYKYKLTVQGTMNRFSGQEEIFFQNKPVYRALLHGGTIQ